MASAAFNSLDGEALNGSPLMSEPLKASLKGRKQTATRILDEFLIPSGSRPATIVEELRCQLGIRVAYLCQHLLDHIQRIAQVLPAVIQRDRPFRQVSVTLIETGILGGNA